MKFIPFTRAIYFSERPPVAGGALGQSDARPAAAREVGAGLATARCAGGEAAGGHPLGADPGAKRQGGWSCLACLPSALEGAMFFLQLQK